MPRGNPDNLKPLNGRPEEERRAIQSAGGKARQAQLAEREEWKTAITNALAAPLPDGVMPEEVSAVVDALLAAKGKKSKKGKKPTVQDAIMGALLKIIINGEPRAVEAAKFVLDQAGEDVTEKQQITVVAGPGVDEFMG